MKETHRPRIVPPEYQDSRSMNQPQDIAELHRKIEDLQQQLAQAQKLSTVGTLASSMTHEFNNILTTIINYAKMAETYGMYSEGPISDPKDLGPALKRAIAKVKSGEPALVDVVTQPR